MKKSSTDNRSGNLEDVFRKGFRDAEVTPSGNLWDRIDKQLDTQEQASVYKKRAAFYGRLALLSLLLLFFAGGAWFYQFQKDKQPALAVNTAGQQAEIAANKQPKSAGSAVSDLTITKPEASQATKTNRATYQGKSTENAQSPARAEAQRSTNPDINLPAEKTEKGAGSQTAIANQAAVASNTKTRNRTRVIAAETARTDPQNSQSRSGKAKQAVKPTPAPATAVTVNNTNTEKGQGQKPAGLQVQNATIPAAPAKNLSTNITEPTTGTAANPPVASAAEIKTTKNGSLENAAPADNTSSGNTIAPTQPAADSAKKVTESVVVVTSPTVTDSALIGPPPVPAAKGAFSVSALYGGYQFEQGLIVSNTVPGAAPPSAAYRQAAREFNELTKPASSYRAEVRAAYWVHNRVRIEAGLSYSRNRAITLSTYEIQNFIYNPGSGAMVLANQSSIIEPVLSGALRDSVAAVSVPEFETSYQYDYLALPVRVAYQSDTKGWHWFASGGASVARLLNSKITSTRSNLAADQNSKEAFRDWNFAGVFSFGLGYQFNERLSLGAGPDLSYSLNSLMNSRKAGIRQANPYTLGLAGGLTYTFR